MLFVHFGTLNFVVTMVENNCQVSGMNFQKTNFLNEILLVHDQRRSQGSQRPSKKEKVHIKETHKKD